MNSFIDIRNLDISEINQLVELAESYKRNSKTTSLSHELLGIPVCLAFFENSTRTKLSFELAAKRLNAIVLNFETNNSSLTKGETILETIRTMEAMGVKMFVIRHSENHILQFLQNEINSVFINAGDGNNSHPTQALLDLLSIREHFGINVSGLRLCIVGDIKHSRVARSNFELLSKMGVDISFAVPNEFTSDYMTSSYNNFKSIDEAIENNDLIMCLRIQKERMDTSSLSNLDSFIDSYGLKSRHLEKNNKLIFMHPGPVNYGIEIEKTLINHPNSLINKQVTNGVFARMAVLSHYANQIK